MKSKKWIATAMLVMFLVSIARPLFSQSKTVEDTNNDVVLAMRTSFEISNEAETVSALPTISTEVAQIEAVPLLMSAQVPEGLLSDATTGEVAADEETLTEETDENAAEEATQEETVTEEITTEETIQETTQEETTASYVISCSDDEYWLLCRLVESEAGTTDVTGRIMVANVVINRVKSSYFPNTITDVVYSANQFMPVTTGYIWQVNISDLDIEAVNRALLGEDYSQGATYFSSTASAAAGNWQSRALTRLFEYGGNVFYCE